MQVFVQNTHLREAQQNIFHHDRLYSRRNEFEIKARLGCLSAETRKERRKKKSDLKRPTVLQPRPWRLREVLFCTECL